MFKKSVQNVFGYDELNKSEFLTNDKLIFPEIPI